MNVQPTAPATEPFVRVLLRDQCTSVLLNATEPPLIRVSGSDSVRRLLLDPGTTVRLALSPSGWRVNDIQLGNGIVEIDPAADGTLRVDGLLYHGHFRLIPTGQERFDLVNELGVEDYLKGVLARELLPKWAIQTYQAQAVAARTYVIYEIKSAAPGSNFDVYDDQRSQMYGGVAAENAKANLAVETTSGMVVVAGPPGDQHIFKAYFCSCCGGIGQSAHDAFGDAPSPELAAKENGSLCSASPNYNWGPITISMDELTRRFRIFGQRNNRPEAFMSPVNRIDIIDRNTLGRPVRFEVTCDDGNRFNWSGEELRHAVDTDASPTTMLKSSFVKIDNKPAEISFTGHGYGHGVGMCQWSAQARALMGLPYERIVTLAYPTASLVKAY